MLFSHRYSRFYVPDSLRCHTGGITLNFRISLARQAERILWSSTLWVLWVMLLTALLKILNTHTWGDFSKSKLRYIEMHITHRDPNKMLFFHVVTVLCNALFLSFDKLLYFSRKKVFCFVSKPEMQRPLHLVVAVNSWSSQCFLTSQKKWVFQAEEVWLLTQRREQEEREKRGWRQRSRRRRKHLRLPFHFLPVTVRNRKCILSKELMCILPPNVLWKNMVKVNKVKLFL
jgi:hypothetical protein